MKGIRSTIWLRGVIYILPIASMGALLFIWNSTNPAEAGPMGVFIVFILLYLFWLGVMFALLRVGTFLAKRIFKKISMRHSSEKLAYYIASVVAFVPVLLLAMQSVGQLELRDVVLVLVFAMLAIFYIIKRA